MLMHVALTPHDCLQRAKEQVKELLHLARMALDRWLIFACLCREDSIAIHADALLTELEQQTGLDLDQLPPQIMPALEGIYTRQAWGVHLSDCGEVLSFAVPVLYGVDDAEPNAETH